MSMHRCIRSFVPHVCLSTMLKGISCLGTHLLLLLFWLCLGLTNSEASFRPQGFLSGSTWSGISMFWLIKERRLRVEATHSGSRSWRPTRLVQPPLREEPQTEVHQLRCSSPGNSSSVSRRELLWIESTLLRVGWRTWNSLHKESC